MRIRTRVQAALTLIIVSYAVAPHRVIAQCDSGTVCTCSDCPHVDRTYRQGRWFVLETANFQVCCEQSETSAQHVARHAEALRAKLTATWFDVATGTPWQPKCQIVLHSSRQSYTAAVGRGSERTVGSSLVSTEKNQITGRRVDLLGDGVQFLSAALPHELTHVVLRDRSPATGIPRWADEGVAMLADPKAKQDRHRQDLRDAVARGATFNVASLLSMDEYPRSDRWGTFYGQSASLTKFLVERKSPEHFVSFIEDATSKGYEAALQEYYGIANLADLDRQWRRQLHSL